MTNLNESQDLLQEQPIEQKTENNNSAIENQFTKEEWKQYRKDRAKIMSQIQEVQFNRINNHFKQEYFDINEVHRVIKKGIGELFYYDIKISNTNIIFTLTHCETGIFEKLTLQREDIVNKSMQNIQHYGSWVTYASRYILTSFFALSAEDSDGEETRAEYILGLIEKCKKFGEEGFKDEAFCKKYNLEHIDLDSIKYLEQDVKNSMERSLQEKLKLLEKQQKQNKPAPSNQIV